MFNLFKSILNLWSLLILKISISFLILCIQHTLVFAWWELEIVILCSVVLIARIQPHAWSALDHKLASRGKRVSCNYVIFIYRSGGQVCEDVWKTISCLLDVYCHVTSSTEKHQSHSSTRQLLLSVRKSVTVTSWCAASCLSVSIRREFLNHLSDDIDCLPCLEA